MADSPLTVNFQLPGIQESKRVIGWSIDSGYLTSTDAFSFQFLPGSRPEFRDLELQPVELLVNGSSQLLGRIERTVIGNAGTMVECSGRDYIADLVECNVDPAFRVLESMTLGQAIRDVCAPCGILSVLSHDETGFESVRAGISIKKGKRRKKTSSPLQAVQPRQGGEGIYEYCNRLCARHGATLQPDADRSVVTISSPDYTSGIAGTIRCTASGIGSTNNVINATAERDYSRMPTYVLANGKKAGRSDEKATGLSNDIDVLLLSKGFSPEMERIIAKAILARRQKPAAPRDEAVRLYRLLRVEDHDARTQDELQAAMIRAFAERLKDSLCYRVTLKGHTDPETRAIWTVNTMVQVRDEIRGLDEPLWVASRKLAYSQSDGATTELELWRPGSFQIEPPES